MKKLTGKQTWFKNKPRDTKEELEKAKERREMIKEEKRPVPDDFDVTWFAYFINFYPDIGDYLYGYNKKKVCF